jgi:hypothetical protein
MRALEHEQRLVARERETLEAAEGRMRQREDAAEAARGDVQTPAERGAGKQRVAGLDARIDDVIAG